MVLVEDFLTQQWMGFPVSQVSRRGSNQFGDFMAVLELGAVDLNYPAGVANQPLGRGFDEPGFPGPGRAQEKEISYRPSGA